MAYDSAFRRPLDAKYTPPAEWDMSDPRLDPAKLSRASLFPDAWYGSRICEDHFTPLASFGEFDHLQRLRVTQRAQRHSEILRQADGFDLCGHFIDVVMEAFSLRGLGTGYDEVRKPLDICREALAEVHLLVILQKQLYNRARPYQVFPELDPMFCPGHSSYPSGHATEASAVAMLLARAMSHLGDPYRLPRERALESARRVAENREVAGVHFPSDTAAGVALAQLCVDQLCTPGPFHENFRLLKAFFPAP
jgi:acid phosphatase (class A)